MNLSMCCLRRIAAANLCASLLFAAAATAASAQATGTSAQSAASDDKYFWLEDVSSPRALDWVKAENARSAAVLENDPHYKPFLAEAIKLGEDPARLPYPDLRGDTVYNFWRDKANPRGLYRKTTFSSYMTKDPHWSSVLDFDALGKKEGVNWVPHGFSCLYPSDKLCMVSLSAGGEDASTDREFDLTTSQFVDGGFTLPRSKGTVTFLDKDTLLMARDWGADTNTKSGYPFVIKEWKRGTPLAEAKEVFRGSATDEVSSFPVVLNDPQGEQLVYFARGVTFFEFQTFVRTPTGVKRLNIPSKTEIVDLFRGRVLLRTHEDWTVAGSTFKQGSLLEVKLADVWNDPEHLKPAVIFAPSGTEFLQNLSTSKTRLLITTLDNVKGRAYVYTPTASGWSKERLEVPENASVGIVSTNPHDDRFFVSIESFLQPDSLWLGDASQGAAITKVKSEPDHFETAGLTVDQFFATSKDGTKVPYFAVHKKDIKFDGSTPTLLNAYGGFEISMTPGYRPQMGKLWLERGGVYVLANIRGGGEFGPAWHDAGLKTNRQRIYDDFAAVGQDLIARKITSPRHLGIIGGSNGGLLMGVEMTQHPDLWNAVVIQVPLLDMLRFEQIAAGASWVGEFGSVSKPEERTFLAKISPYNQLQPGVKYPEPFIFTTTKDDRVGPQHARKFAAKMEEFHEPFFYDELIEGGHGAGADIKEEARTYALTYVYLTRKLME